MSVSSTLSSVAQALIVALALANMGAAQTSMQDEGSASSSAVTFHLPYISPEAPVRIVRLMLGNDEIPANTPIPVKGMWLRDFSVVLQNVSPKTIVSGGIILTYPETGDGTAARPTISTPVIRGKRPDHAYLNKDGTHRPRQQEGSPSAPLAIKPGETLTLTVGPHPGDLNQSTANKAAGQLTRVNIQLTEYYFSDESMWNSGAYYIPEPAPERYRRVMPAEFTSEKSPFAQ